LLFKLNYIKSSLFKLEKITPSKHLKLVESEVESEQVPEKYKIHLLLKFLL